MTAVSPDALGHVVGTEDELRSIVSAPTGYVVDKELDHIDQFARAFIAHSPFFVLATADADGRLDATPRGDPPGFVHVLDDKHLLIPDRKGNHRVDSMRNILSNPRVGTLFLIPGREDSLRINGRATITSDPDLLAPLEFKGKPPKLGILVEAEEVFFQCAAALNRSHLWKSEHWPDPSSVVSLGTALIEQAKMEGVTAEELDEGLEGWNANPY